MTSAKESGRGGAGRATEPSTSTVFVAGFAAGLVVTTVLNPFDRALYLCVLEHRAFLHPANWRSPFKAWKQTLVSRAMSSGLYFPLEQTVLTHAERAQLSPGVATALAGQLAGSVNGLLLSPLAIVKYQTWGHPDEQRSFGRMARHMYVDGGAVAFLRGMPATVTRDSVFGCTFTVLRTRLRGMHLTMLGGNSMTVPEFIADAFAAAVATTASSPFNFVRNVQFGAKSADEAKRWHVVLADLLAEARSRPSSFSAGMYIAGRLNVGWGTCRVALGMALTAKTFRTMLGIANSCERMALAT